MISWKSDIFLLNRRPYFWIALAGLVLYARSVRFDFTYLDDFIMVFNGLNAAGKPSGIFGIFFHNLYMSSEYYRPILSLSFIIDGKLWGLNPMGYHVTNVMLHILASCLVYKLFMGLGYDRKPAFAFSLLFIAHPLLSQAACWLPGRNDSLLAVFSLSSFILLISFLEKVNTTHYLLHQIFFMLALLTKEPAIGLAAVFCVYIFGVRRRYGSLRTRLNLTAGYLLVLILWFSLRSNIMYGRPDPNVEYYAGNIMTNFSAVFAYIGKAVFPLGLSTWPTKETFLYTYIPAVLIFVPLLFLGKMGTNKIFGLIWILAFILPTLSIKEFVFFDQRFYMPLVGLCIIVMEADFVRRRHDKKIFVFLFLAVFVSFFSIAFLHSGNFRNKTRFWENAMKNSPENFKVRIGMAVTYYENGDIDKAFQLLKKESEKSDDMLTHCYLGKIYAKKSMFYDAETEFKKAISMEPVFVENYIGLSELYKEQGRIGDARRIIARAFELNSKSDEAMACLEPYRDILGRD